MIKHTLFLFLCCLATISQAAYSDWFTGEQLRMDYFHSGNQQEDFYTFDEIRIEPEFGGSHNHLIDTFEYGSYLVKMFDQESNTLLYSRGYSTLFGEWQLTSEAKTVTRSFSETVVMPCPRHDVRIELYSRDKKGNFTHRFTYNANMSRYDITHELRMEYPLYEAAVTGPAAERVDVVILPEGYTAEEMGQFLKDCKQFTTDMLTYAPYSENRDKFNIWAILAPSPESGTDIPGDSIWKRTLLNTRFYTFDSERYLMTTDNKSVRDMAANAPYDQIYILVNTTKYGGGAIYNHYNVSVNSNRYAAKILTHEFGHGFAGLADEYYDDSTGYDDPMYDTTVEPWEPNITTLVNFETKWKHLLNKKTPIPTPATEKNRAKLGVYEGGGYMTKGVYRPRIDCLMHTFKGDIFCGACDEAIQKMIDFYSK